MPEDCIVSPHLSPIPGDLFAEAPGGAPAALHSRSRFDEPIGAGGWRGKSRRWGDAAVDTQSAVIDVIIRESCALGYTPLETAFALAVARTESGFNPDAAAGSTSASGVGQFIDATGESYGLNDSNRFSAVENVRAMLKHLQDCIAGALRRSGSGDPKEVLATAYALYHDGPSLAYGGKEIAARTVLPWTERFFRWFAGS
jgi:putative chitinase